MYLCGRMGNRFQCAKERREILTAKEICKNSSRVLKSSAAIMDLSCDTAGGSDDAAVWYKICKIMSYNSINKMKMCRN